MAKPNLTSNPKPLASINYQVSQEGDSWTPAYFSGAYEGLQGLNKLDLSTPEGLNKFYGVVNEPSARNWDTATIGKAKKNLVGMVQTGLVRNSLKNIGGLAGILDNSVATGLNLSFPGFYAKDSSEPYVAVAKAITNAQSVAQDIENDPKAYFARKLEGLSDMSKVFWSTLSREVLQADQSISQRKAFEALKAYGSSQRYLADNVATANKLVEEFKTEEDKLQQEIQKAYQMRASELGGNLTAQEEIDFRKSFEERQKKLFETYEQGARASEVLPKMIGGVMESAYATLKKQKEEADKAKDKSSKDSGKGSSKK